MSNIDSDFSGSIPEIYNSHLVPILFEGFAEDLAERVARTDPRDVLEVAAGSGAVTRALAPRLGDQSRYVVTDLNPGMLERARQHHEDNRLEWLEANAMSLPFEDDSFDVVLCQFGVMFFPDRIKGFSEARRVLRSGGRFIFNSWGPLEENDFSHVAVETLIKLYPEDPPLFLARTPFGYSEKSQVQADLAAAGFEDVQIENMKLKSRADTADDFAFGQSCGSPLRLEIEARGEPPLQEVRTAIAEALVARFGRGQITGRMMALVAQAKAP
ncbi:Ubiquinone/menaquinone biosynthesis C-methyltransferase UbiE (plasmid) [Roseovarius sp. THAF9]|uniref:class I SAM-dependent methyltransferase n=1 Tax=Roseovarius sp. THAF9 TaxID=2587847 RepID=UPI0012696813|nr:class I SAM-dependent methyltransferase [Roseovarius sp. THAF9]QFT95191.1 Ubiquinone/menaquinone biosynthesis C-methyltransferase UbiE [Roseovarius sp. THAF9]